MDAVFIQRVTLFNIYFDRISTILGAQGSSETGAEGILTRKHDWESTTKKAANRSWDKVKLHRTLVNLHFHSILL